MDYLTDFYHRAQPLADVSALLEESRALFAKKWSAGEIEGWNLRRTIEELQEILDSDEKRDNVVIEEMDQAAKAYGDARRTVIMSDEGALVAAQGSLAGARSGGASTAAASGDGASGAAGVAGADALGAGLPPAASAPHGAHDLTVIDTAAVSQALKTQDASEVLQIDDAPATVVLSADGQIARMGESAMDLFSTRDASTPLQVAWCWPM